METKNEKTKVETVTNEAPKVNTKIRKICVCITIAIFSIISYISLRADYLNVVEIGEKYSSIFFTNLKNKYMVFFVSFFIMCIIMYVTNIFIRRGLKKFFSDENKKMPKLPNKSLCFIISIIGAAISTSMLSDKLAVFLNAGVFGQGDQIFGADIGYYMFALPFIQSILIFLIEIIAFLVIYIALYYVITLNKYLDGVNGETLKKNTFIKHEIFMVMLAIIVLSVFIYINSQNILTDEMLTISNDSTEVSIVGASAADVKIKVWGYRILSFVIVISSFVALRFIRKKVAKKAIIAIAVVPTYLVCFFVTLVYFQSVHVKSNELDNEKQYIGYNIESTKKAYGIDISQENLNEYQAVTASELNENADVVNNIPLISKEVTLTSAEERQENSVYYSYENTFLANYTINGENKLVYITPREVLSDSSVSYNNKTYKYTHGYSLVVNTVSDEDEDGYAEYLISDFSEEDILKITEPRIYFGLETNSTILTNTSFGKEYDYPITATTNSENVYDGEAGLNLGFLDRLILGIDEKNYKLAFSGNVTKDTKVIANRNVIERAKKLLPDVLYDENPYLVVTDEGRLVWVLDAYTRSDAYPYSQKYTVDIKGYKEEINYIRNSLKILIDAYDGTTTFYITDRTDPIIMTYAKMYPDLFASETETIPEDIQKHLIYPKFMYQIQAHIATVYHEISEDVLYRASDIWQVTSAPSTANSSVAGANMEPYYTMLKTADSESAKLGLMLTYSKLEKQNIIAYLVGTVENGKSVLKLYKYSSDQSDIIGPVQLNSLIEQDENISAELKALNTSGVKVTKNMIIVPINNSLLYVEAVYQTRLNEKNSTPILKKVIVASGNVVAIGDNLEDALANLFNDKTAIDLDYVNTDSINELVDAVIKANSNLYDSLYSNDFEMIGKDISSLQSLINELQGARQKEIEKEAELEKEKSKVKNTNTVKEETNENVILENVNVVE